MVKIFGQHDEATVEQLQRCAAAEEAAPAVLCADGHLGYSMPIGGVVGYREHISPSGVGFDIGCGNKAVLTDADASDVKANISKIMDDVFSTISFGIGRNNNESVDHELFDDDAWQLAAVNPLKRM